MTPRILSAPQASVATTASGSRKTKLLDRAGNLFEAVELGISNPEAVLFANRVFLPTKISGEYRECRWDWVPLPSMRNLQGW
jgi:hypothetical protein